MGVTLVSSKRPGSWLASPQVRRESAAQVTYRLLRDAMVNHELAPGARLLEPELAVHLSVSRTPVREALRALEADGFVRRLPTGGLAVAEVDARDVAELYQIRMALESLAAREAARRATMADARELVSILDEADRSADDSRALFVLGERFHRRIAEVADNRRAAEILDKLHDHIVRYRLAAAVENRERQDGARQEHRRVAEAILDGNAVGAERAMSAHARRESAFLVKALTPAAAPRPSGSRALRPAMAEMP